MTPDPAGLAAADPSNPQSWNRYAYVLNNPLAFTDPSGLGPQCHQDIPLACPNQFGGGGPDSNLPGDIFSSWNEFDVLGFAYTPGGTVTVLTEQNGEPVFVQVPTYPNIGALSLLPQFPSSSGLASWGLFAANNLGQKPTVNWFANSNCQYTYLNSQYGPGASSFVSRFSLLSYTPLASGPSANAGETIVPTIATEGTKLGVGYLLKLAGASSESLSAWGAMTLIPTFLGTAYDAEAKYACRSVTGTNPQGW